MSRGACGVSGAVFQPQRTLRPEAFASFESFLSEAARFEHDVRCYDDVLSFVAEVRDRTRRERRIAEAFPRGIHDPAFRKLLKSDLYAYQREGALFAARAGRCLIGDEMGLGKTIQAIATAEIMARQLGVERVLIVCPTSLKHQWEREIARFTNCRTTVVGGLRGRREPLYSVADDFFKITNHDIVHSDLDLIRSWSPAWSSSTKPSASRTGTPDGPQRETYRFAVRHRADGHAAREPARGARLNRGIHRQTSPRPNVQVLGGSPDALRTW
jgi:hypothetical protein